MSHACALVLLCGVPVASPALVGPSVVCSWLLPCDTPGSGAVGRGLQPEDAVVVFARSCGSVCNKPPLHTLGYEPHKEEYCHRRGVYFHQHRCTIGLACAQAVAIRGAPHVARRHAAVPRALQLRVALDDWDRNDVHERVRA